MLSSLSSLSPAAFGFTATELAASSSSSRSSSLRTSAKQRQQRPQHTIGNCGKFVGQPLSRQAAQAKLDRCPAFEQAVSEFKSFGYDTVEKAIKLDYGFRLRNCLLANKSPRRKSDRRE